MDIIGEETLKIISESPKFNEWMYQTIKPFLKGEILEIGSGIGNISSLIVRDYNNVTLTDYSDHYINKLNKTFEDNTSVKKILNIDIQKSDFKVHYAHLENSFDTIIILNVVEHLENDTQAINNCHFLLKPKGSLVVLTPAYNFLYCNFDKNLGHYRRYNKKSLSLLFKKDLFSIRKRIYFNALGIIGWLMIGKIGNKEKIGNGEFKLFSKLIFLGKLIDKIFFHKIGLSIIVVGEKS